VSLCAPLQQQFCWNKGGAENFRKMNWRVITSKYFVKTKIHGIIAFTQ
jgi:hypothetical protein